MFLGVTPSVIDWKEDGKEFSLQIDDNPLIEFIELPEDLKDYCAQISSAVYFVVL
jgi:hypothetical protein